MVPSGGVPPYKCRLEVTIVYLVFIHLLFLLASILDLTENVLLVLCLPLAMKCL